MKRLIISSILIILMAGSQAGATLMVSAPGLIYDSDQNLTWLQDANQIGRRVDWQGALTWADNLEYGGYDDWRLPSAGLNPVTGYDNKSEMGYLYNDLRNPYGPGGFENAGPFINLQAHRYWTGTEFDSGVFDATPILNAWQFRMLDGWAFNTLPGVTAYTMAVRSGPVTIHPNPEPATIFLLGTGLLGVIGFARRKKK